ncbi:MAG: hypothetical protein J6D11_08100 [Clostridia bacterium]|nr:hypothetical protein [Clostridia bacterium]
MNYTYIVISNKGFTTKDECAEYGIAAESAGKILERICDVTTDFDEITKLVEKCNKYKLSLVHMKDVVEDFILGR